MIIRRMTLRDVDPVHRLGSACREFDISQQTDPFWTKEALTRWCKSRNDVTLVAEENGEIVGFSLFAYHRPTGKATFENLFVASAHRKAGIGARLVEAGLAQLRKRKCFIVVALTETDNEPINSAMRALGFQPQKQFIWHDREP